MDAEKIWYDDLKGFMTADNYLAVLPQQNMSMEQKLNAILRFAIYLGVAMAIIKADYRYLFIGIVMGAITIVLYEHYRKEFKKNEKFLQQKNLDIVDNKVCSKSTVENPFMNVLNNEYATNPDRPPACNVLNDKVQQNIEDNFNARLFRDVSDIYGKMSSQREFYTMPNTTIPNDQQAFAEWCYGVGPTCKEGNGRQCLQNIHSPVQVSWFLFA